MYIYVYIYTHPYLREEALVDRHCPHASLVGHLNQQVAHVGVACRLLLLYSF